MSVVVPTGGAKWLGNLMLGINGYASMQVHLYTNFWVPTCNDTIANYVELNWAGYSPFTLFPDEWSYDAEPCVANYAYPLYTFVLDPNGGPAQTVFGYWVDNAAGILLWAEAFAAPFPIPPEGGNIPLNLYFTDERCAD